MQAWFVLISILAILTLLLCTRIRVIFLYRDTIKVRLGYGPFRFALYPRKKKVKIQAFSYKNLKKKKKTSISQKSKDKKSSPPFKEQISLLLYIFRSLYAKFLRYFRMDVAKIHVEVATGDAAQTAILYGIVAQSISYIAGILYEHANFRCKSRTAICVSPNFLGDTSQADCHIVFSLQTWQIIGLGLKFSKSYFEKKRNKKDMKKQTEGDIYDGKQIK